LSPLTAHTAEQSVLAMIGTPRRRTPRRTDQLVKATIQLADLLNAIRGSELWLSAVPGR